MSSTFAARSCEPRLGGIHFLVPLSFHRSALPTMAPRLLLRALVPLLAIFLGLAFYKNVTVSSLPVIQSLTLTRCQASPHAASWGTWFHPLQSPAEEGAKSSRKDWNLLHHLGGNGPWIEKTGGTEGSSLAPPEGCSVDQVHLVCFQT